MSMSMSMSMNTKTIASARKDWTRKRCVKLTRQMRKGPFHQQDRHRRRPSRLVPARSEAIKPGQDSTAKPVSTVSVKQQVRPNHSCQEPLHC